MSRNDLLCKADTAGCQVTAVAGCTVERGLMYQCTLSQVHTEEDRGE